MRFLSFLLMQLLAAYTILAEPFLRTNFYRNLKKQLDINPNARLLFYRTQILWELSWIAVLVLILIPIPAPLTWIGLNIPSTFGVVIMLVLLLGVGLSTALLRRNPGAMSAMQRNLEATSSTLPSTPRERRWFTATAVTAGICEELLYRGFLLNYLVITFPGLDFIIASIISGIVYGLSRAYQGRKGIIQTALTGFSFAIVYFLSGNLLTVVGGDRSVGIYGSLIPAMVFHIAAELRTLVVWHPEEQQNKIR